MATLKMKKLRLIGLLEDKDKLVDVLCGLGSVEVVKPPVIEHTKDMEVNEELKNAIVEKLTRIHNAIVFVDEQTRERLAIAKKAKDKSVKKPASIFLGGRPLIDDKDFHAVAKKEQELLDGAVVPAEQMSVRVKELTTLITALETQISALKVYKDVDVEASGIKATEHSVVGLGTVKNATAVEKLSAAHPSAQFSVAGTLTEGKKNKPVAFAILYACVPGDAEAVKKSLAEIGFEPAVFDFKTTPKAWYNELTTLLGKYRAEKTEILNSSFALNAQIPELKILFDILSIELQKAELVSKMTFTDTVFVLDGWIAAVSEKTVTNAISAASKNIELEISEPEAEDAPPTLQKHNTFVRPYSLVTNMYSVPNSKELDPNPVMSFFYMFLFGIMLADAIYGLVLAALCFTILKLKKPTGGGKRLLQVVMMGGLAAIFWGIMFGSYMGFSKGPITDWEKAQLSFLPPTVLMSPLADPFQMLLLSVIIGAIHIIFALGIKFAQRIKDKNVFDALLDALPWMLILTGAILVILPMVISDATHPLPYLYVENLDFGIFPLILIGIGLFGLLFSGRKKKGVVGKVGGALGGYYGAIAYLSDLLSYARLFGLALSGGVVAMVFNILGGLMMGGIASILGVVIMLVGFAFNLFLSVLGVYVHTSRLQYIEFFGKFYSGEGFLFKPLGSETKYNEVTGTSLSADMATKK